MLAASLVAAFLCGCAGSHAGGEPQANLVKMTNGLKYAPAEITITADVALPAGAGPFNSGNIGLGKEFSYTFTVPGTYKYFCIPHETSGMTGTVIVNKAP
jgi:plastocyanin